MNRTLQLALFAGAIGVATTAHGQRYLQEVFTNAQLTITPDVTYGTNINFLTSNFASANVPAEILELQTAVSLGNPIPAAYFTAGDPATAIKVVDLQMDIYEPDQTIDAVTDRPVVIYVHTGNALPPPVNGSPNGTRKDSSAVEVCTRMARRGYVAISMSYRGGWNPLGSSLEVRRGTLLNAIYRAIHDVRQCVRTVKAEAPGLAIDPTRIIVIGEGTGGYIALAHATLDRGAELFVEKFVPDPLGAPNVSYIDTNLVGNLSGFAGQLALYRPNGQSHETHFCANLGGALADTLWLEAGDQPMVAFHTVFDPFAPFSNGIVIVPTTGEQVVDVNGSNVFMRNVNAFGNNSSFASLPGGDPFTDRARALYGTTQTHGSTNVSIGTSEGLFPLVRPAWPAPAMEEASPWQWWNPTSPLALTEVAPGVTAHMASLASNPDMSAAKGRAYIDTIMGYLNPRIVCALDLGPCSLVGLSENSAVAQGVEVFPNPASNNVTFTSSSATILSYEVFDVNGRLVRTASVNADRAVMERQELKPGAYTVQLRFKDGAVARKLMLD
jgi:acetyl esterase/lipase